MKFLMLLAIILSSKESFSYPNFISYGYSKCLTCHYNPYGNGPLTDYGRALSAITVSDRILQPKDKSEDEIAMNSRFLYMDEFKNWIRPSIDYRGLYLERNYNNKQNETEIIHMQAEVNTVFRYKGQDNLFISLSYGYAPVPERLKDQNIDEYRSREHYIAWRPKEELGFYLGLMDKVYGIRIADHIAFSRVTTGLTQNDQTHGLMMHYFQDKHELGVHAFIGNLVQEIDLRQKGVSAKYEYEYLFNIKPGISFLRSENDYYRNENISLHSKLAFSKGSSLLIEVGKATKTNLLTNSPVTSNFMLLQNHMLIKRGLQLLVTTDYLKPDSESAVEIVRLGPGFQYFINQGIELRFDAYNTKTFNPNAAGADSWDLAGQLHLWF